MCPVKSFMSAGDQQSDHLVDHEGHVLVKKALQLLGSLARRSSLHGSMDVPQRASRLSPFFKSAWLFHSLVLGHALVKLHLTAAFVIYCRMIILVDELIIFYSE